MPIYRQLGHIIEMSGKKGMERQNKSGSLPQGHNGPYYDPETPVRNTAHWLFLFASLYIKTGDTKWKAAAYKVIEFLLSPEARPYAKSFHCRDKQGKDRCNGLIGQAWVIEALVKASEAFDRQDCYKLAQEVFLLHPWDKNIGIWKRLEVDGSVLPYDRTFNHQLWFAAMAGLLAKTPEAQNRAKVFLEKVAARVQLYGNGVVFHSSKMGLLIDYLKSGLKPFLREMVLHLRKKSKLYMLYSKSAGYHAFNLYAFSMLKKAFPDSPLWQSKTFKTLITAHRNDRFINDVKASEFGYRYNLSGIEIAYAVETFFKDKQEAGTWLNRQFQETYLDDSQPLSRSVSDTNTANARIYQAARLVNEYEVIIG